MKKLAIAALMLVTFAGASFAQTAPKKKSSKMEMKKDDSKMSDTTTHKHMHKGMKHSKSKM